MTEKERLYFTYMENQEVARKQLSLSNSNITGNLIWAILQDHFDTGIFYTEIFFKELSSEAIVKIVTDYLADNGALLGEILFDKQVDVTLPSDELKKAKVKFSGDVWYVYKTDKDPFPSSPHAHNYSKNLKLHLGNGDLYLKKEIVGNMKKNELTAFRKLVKAQIKNIELPKLND